MNLTTQQYIGIGIVSLTIVIGLLFKKKKPSRPLTTPDSDHVILCTTSQKISYPPGSPSVCKLLGFLQANKLDYSIRYVRDFSESPKGKIPYVCYKGEVLADSHFIIKRLIKDGVVQDPDGWLNDQQKAVSTFVQQAAESTLY